MLKDMKTQKHLKPGQQGTKRLVEQFGDALVCVRYRYDAIHGVRLKTVEIIVEEKPCTTAPHRDEEIVPVVVAYTEKPLRDKLKAAGAKWDPQEKVWLIAYGKIRGTELEDRICPA
ncbi:hypothetical protein [Geotalea sp. SG265]|uniref:hypothetical protein n=1 Tax=Geotalea sp. SG265 TaxID=2922867 RepID=UPI001FAF271A|nr:hypothetical protein [Geotalea sp. SG265]